MPIWPQSTVELEQRQWHWLNVFLATTNVAGVPAATAGVLSSQAAYGYRYEGPTGFTARVLDSFTFVVTTGYDYSGSATGSSDLTMRVTAAAGSLPPTNGRVTANNGVDAPETFNYVSYNESTGVITLSTALTANYTAGATTLTRIDWFDAGTGYYSLLITPTEIANTGTFTVRVGNLAGSTFDVFGQNVEVVPYTGINSSVPPTYLHLIWARSRSSRYCGTKYLCICSYVSYSCYGVRRSVHGYGCYCEDGFEWILPSNYSAANHG